MRRPIYTVLLKIIIGIILMTFAMFPYLVTVLGSFSSNSDLIIGNFLNISKYTFNNYISAFEVTNFGRALANSFINSLLAALLAVLISAPSAYAFSRTHFKFKKYLLILILATQLFPMALIIVPLYQVISIFHLINTYGGLALAYLTQTIPLSLWLLIMFFNSVPIELDEAAKIDGCNSWKTFYKVILPLSLPGITTVLFFAFMAAWNDLMFISVLAQSNSMSTVQLLLYSMIGQYSTSWGLMLSMSIMGTIPAVVLYFIVQKSLVAGIMAGAVKG
ncbi:MAG: carbohydrate ABC transporter permease [Thermoplasmata archaeon]